MNKLLTSLIATTCVAVIATIGYHFVGELQAYRARPPVIELYSREEMFALVGLNSERQVRELCVSISAKRRFSKQLDKFSDEVERIVETCRSFGYL